MNYIKGTSELIIMLTKLIAFGGLVHWLVV